MPKNTDDEIPEVEPISSKEGMVTYILDMPGGDKRVIRVPEDWRVTFSAGINPAQDHRYQGGTGGCVRIYETKEKQRAVILNVLGMTCDLIESETFTQKVYFESERGPEGHREESRVQIVPALDLPTTF